MRDIVREYQEKFRQDRQRVRRHTALLLALALTTSLFVNWQLHGVGIAKTADYLCGKEEHEHTAACYPLKLVCGYEEGQPEDPTAALPEEDAGFDAAFGVDADGNYGSSTESSSVPAVEEPEYIYVPHEHTEDCYQEVQVLTCTEEEHEHTDDCFNPEDNSLICEIIPHTHDDSCYTTEQELVCGLEEGELVEEPNPDYVAPDEAAYVVFDNAVTELPVVVSNEDSTQDVPVHHHTDACYAPDYDADPICGLEEHHHTVNCLTDPLADVEDEADWLAQTGISLSGIWNEDLLAVAQAELQQGYEQSEKNFELDADDGVTVRHYTRYGAWYGNAYGPWDVTFLSYCLNYANIPQSAIPQRAGVLSLRSDLNSSGYLTKLSDGVLVPDGDAAALSADDVYPVSASDFMPGDIVFYNSTTTTDTLVVDSDSAQEPAANTDTGISTLPLEPGLPVVTEPAETDDAAADAGQDAEPEAAENSIDAVPEIREQTVATETVGIVSSVDEASDTLTVISGDVDGKVAEVPVSLSQLTGVISVASVQAAEESGADTLDVFDKDQSIDISSYIDEFYIQKKSGGGWVSATDFSTNDQVRANFKFTGIPATEIAKKNYTAYIPLPAGIDCSLLEDGYIIDDTYTAGSTDSTGHHISGKFRFVQDGDHYVAVLEYDKDYIEQYEKNNTTVRGDLNFSFSWDVDKIGTDEKKTISVGNKTLEITLKKEDKPDDTKNKFSLSKSAGKLRMNGTTAYIDYTITLTVKSELKGPLTLTDVLTGNGFTYDSNLKIDPSSVSASWADTPDGKTITLGSEDTTFAPGTYTITYSVKKENFGTTASAGKVENTITMTKDGEKHSDDASSSVETSNIKKTGSAENKNGENYIKWTITINGGDVQRYLKKASFSDVIPDGQTFVGISSVKKNGEKLDENSSDYPSYDETSRTLSAALEDGYNTYTITYKTKVDSDIPLDGIMVSNTASIKGDGIDDSAKDDVSVSNTVLKKSTVGDPSISNGTAVLNWSSHIDVTDLEGYIYYDYSGTVYDGTQHINPQKIDLSTIHVTNASGDVTDKLAGKITAYSHPDSNNVECGLFQIDFSDSGITGPVDITYTTTADVSGLGKNFSIANHAILTKDGHSQTADASHRINNVDDTSKTLMKFAGSWNDSGSGSTDLKLGDQLEWTVVVNHGGTIPSSAGDWVVEDTLPEGLLLDKTSIELTFNYKNPTPVEGTDYKVNILERNGRTVIQVVLYPSAYTKSDGTILSDIRLLYKTSLDPESDFCKGDQKSWDFTNDASFTHDGEKTDASFTETVTRNVVGKHGSYDPSTRLLSYNIDINPDGSQLSKDGTSLLDVEDILKVPSGLKGSENTGKKGLVHLEGVSLFTGRRQSDGSLVAVDFVRDLTKVDSESALDDSTYYVEYNSDESQITLKTKIPDKTPYVLVTHYSVMDKLGGYTPADKTYTFTNSVELASVWKAEDQNQNVTYSAGSTSGIDYNADRLTVFKYSGNQSNPLAGAVFELKYWNGTAWQSDKTFTTDSNGSCLFSGLVRDRFYRLEELSAPEGYILPADNEQYFYITASDTSTVALPAGAGIDGAKLTFYSVTNGTYKDFFLYRSNARNPDYVKYGELLVRKAWKNHDGSEITDLSAMDGVVVTLTKHIPATVTVTFVGGQNGSSPITMSVPKGASLTTSCTQDSGITVDGTADWSYDTAYHFNNIQSDLTITFPSFYISPSNTWITGCTSIDTSAVTGESISVPVGVVELNASNNWSYRWENLEIGEGITYTVKETSVDGYTAAYTLNGTALAEGTAFALGTNTSGTSGTGDTVVITNTADESGGYELPSTGGAGTSLYTAAGGAIALAALVCGLCQKRRRERRAD